MKKLVFCLYLILFGFTIYAQGDIDSKMSSASKELSKEFKEFLIANNLTQTKLGVLEFETNSGQVNELGQFISNEFNTWLSMGKNDYTVISRQDIDKILSEKELVQKQRTNNEKIQLIQKYKMVDFLLLGTITQFTNMYRISLRIISAKKGQEGSVAAVKILTFERTEDLDKLYSSNDSKISSEPPKQSKVQEIKENKYTVGSIKEGYIYGPMTLIGGTQTNYLALVRIGEDTFEITGLNNPAIALDINYEIHNGSQYKFVFKITGERTGIYLSHIKVK